MISKAYYSFFIHKHICDDKFIKMAQVMGIKDANKPTDFITALVNLQKDCGVYDLKMSDYGITPDEFEKIAKNAMETMGGLFASDQYPLTIDDCVEILKESYK